MSLLEACERLYGLRGYTLRALAGGVSPHTYLLESEGAATLVLRVEGPESNSSPTNEGVLLALEGLSYPAPRVVRALDGSNTAEHEGIKLVVTTFVEGSLVDSDANSPEGLRAMSRTIGRLHALTPPQEPSLPVADFMPAVQLDWAEGCLLGVEESVPAQWRGRFDELLRTMRSTPSFTDLPACLVHNDCHPGNAVYQENGEVVLIDWDGAGLGASVIDLGFLLIAADTYTPDVPCTGSSDERVHAIVDGYAEHRRPDVAELDALAAAIRYRVTLINAGGFVYHVRLGQFDQVEAAWWDGCDMAEELAERVRRRFQLRAG
jgi:Ser/Thr protein kinase RdoA (MazF antagonist)